MFISRECSLPENIFFLPLSSPFQYPVVVLWQNTSRQNLIMAYDTCSMTLWVLGEWAGYKGSFLLGFFLYDCTWSSLSIQGLFSSSWWDGATLPLVVAGSCCSGLVMCGEHQSPRQIQAQYLQLLASLERGSVVVGLICSKENGIVVLTRD